MIALLLSGELHLAPLEHPKRILDIGTGTGIWAIEMADRFPNAIVIGTDLSPTQPSWYASNRTPRNLTGALVAECHVGYQATFVSKSMIWRAIGYTERIPLITSTQDT